MGLVIPEKSGYDMEYERTAGGNEMNRTLEHILPHVQKPARYTGGEYNAVVKDKRDVDEHEQFPPF